MGCLSTISATKITAFLQNMEAYGINREKILEKANVNPGLLGSPDHRISSNELKRMIQETVKATGNEDIGLLQGEQMIKGFSNIVGYVLMNCSTLGEAAVKYCRYEKIVDGTSITEFRTSGDICFLESTAIDASLAGLRQFSDFRVSGILSYTRLLSGKKLSPAEVHLSYPRPVKTAIHERMFNCPLFFGEASDTLVFNRGDLEQPVIEPNRSLLDMFENIAQSMLYGFGISGAYTERVTNMIIQDIKGDMPTIDSVASRLSMSVRSLQNCLKREGTSYIRLVNDIRKQLAMNYLKEKSIPTDEIAYILGFSESSAFHRAFKRWTKITPGEFRSHTAI